MDVAQLNIWICGICINKGYCILPTNLSIISTFQTALIGVIYVSAIGTALSLDGDDMRAKDNDALEGVASNLWLAGGFLSCLFWVRCAHTMQS